MTAPRSLRNDSVTGGAPNAVWLIVLFVLLVLFVGGLRATPPSACRTVVIDGVTYQEKGHCRR